MGGQTNETWIGYSETSLVCNHGYMPMISPSGITHYAHIDLSGITMELWEILVIFTRRWRHSLRHDYTALLFGFIISFPLYCRGYEKGMSGGRK